MTTVFAEHVPTVPGVGEKAMSRFHLRPETTSLFLEGATMFTDRLKSLDLPIKSFEIRTSLVDDLIV